MITLFWKHAFWRSMYFFWAREAALDGFLPLGGLRIEGRTSDAFKSEPLSWPLSQLPVRCSGCVAASGVAWAVGKSSQGRASCAYRALDSVS